MDNRLYRSKTDRPIAGVAGGLAAWLGLDPSIVRVAWVALSILSGGLFVLVYIVLMLVIPVAPANWQPRGSVGGAPGSGPTPDGSAPNTAWPGDWAQRVGQQAEQAGERAGVVAGLALIALGGWFLVDQYVHIDWAVAWPVVVILLGVALIAGATRRR